jgi:phosphatidate cytidylyltransferase
MIGRISTALQTLRSRGTARPHVEQGQQAPRAPARGRNFWAAIPVGLALLALVLFAAWWNALLFVVVVYGFAVAAYPEWRNALMRQGRVIALTPIIAGTVGMAVSTWFNGREGLVVALLVACAGGIAWRLVEEWVEDTLHDALATTLTLVWIPFLLSFVVLMHQAEDGWIRVTIFILAVVGNDTGGLFFGMLFGKHKMAPIISPKKTWEGAIGGAVLGTAAATATAIFLWDGEWAIGLIVGAVTVVGAVFGDLVESALKRDVDIKDMGGALPGHGGILDRIDSMLFAAPLAYVMFALLVSF